MRRAFVLLLLGYACNGGDTTTDAGTDAGIEEPVWETAFDATDLGWFLYVWGPSPTDVYAVGGSPDEGLIMRYDGSAWREVEVGFPFPLLNWCYGFGPDDITFVGADGTVIHYDGTSFTRQSTPTDQDLWGVWGASPDDLWSVGGRGSAENDATILHFDGVEWTASATPALSRENVFAYYKVWGTASNDVYAVGQRGALVRWNGTVWSEIATEADDDLVSVWGTGPDRIVAVGGRNNGLAVAFDGTTWRYRSLAPIAGLNGVWTRSPDKFHIAGVQGTVATLDFETLEYELEETESFLTLHGIFGTSDGTLYSVGGSLLDIRPPHKGLALQRRLLDGE